MLDKLAEMAAEQALSEVFGTGVHSFPEWVKLRRAVPAAINSAYTQFLTRYREQDPTLIAQLEPQNPLADAPALKAALVAILRRPFDHAGNATDLLVATFRGALPSAYDFTRVQAASRAFWNVLEREVLYIPQLQQLYALGYQRTTADHTRQLAESAALMAEGITALREEVRARPPLLKTGAPLLPGPAIPTNHRPRHNLPQRPYALFVGRDAQLAQLRQLMLPHPRSRIFLVTIDGVGGVGKSTLALELAHTYVTQHAMLPPDEQFSVIIWVSAKQTALTANGIQSRHSTFSSLDDLFREIAIVLDQPELMQAAPEQRQSLIERALHTQRVLLIVDNLETVDDETLLTFLRELPEPTKAIVTTRHRIDVARAIRLVGMPRADALTLIASETTELPVAITADQCEELVQRTGGVPLAIVWSIGRVRRGYSIESILRRLGSGQGDIARFCFGENAQHLRGRSGEILLYALALFDYAVTRSMLGDVAGLADDPFGRDDGLAELLQLSLANQSSDRFSLLPLTRSFALDQLHTVPIQESLLRQCWIETLTTLAHPYRAVHFEQPSPDALIRNGVHLITLIRWAEQHGRPDIILPVASAALYYLDTIGDWGTLVTLSEQCLNYATLLHLEHEKVPLLNSIAWVQSQQGDYQAATATLTIALDQAHHHSGVIWQIEVLIRLSQNLRRMGDIVAAEQRTQDVYILLEQLTGEAHQYAKAEIDFELGKIARDSGEWVRAQQCFDQALTIFSVNETQPHFNPERAWGILGNLGLILHRQHKLAEADDMYIRALRFFRQSGGRAYTTTLLVRRADLLLELGDLAAAQAHAHEGLALATQLGMMQERIQAQQVLMQCALLEGERDV